MAPQFQPPSFLTQQPTPLQSLAAPLSQSIQSLPELWDQYKTRRLQQQMALMEMKRKYGTGEAAPTSPGDFATAPAASLVPGRVTSPAQGSGPEEVMFGTNLSMPSAPAVPVQETPEQKIVRLGTEAYGKLNPAGSMIVPFINREGQQIGSGPANTKVVDKNNTFLFDPVKRQLLDLMGNPVASAPQGADIKVLPPSPEDVAATKLQATLKAEKPKAAGSFNNTMREYDNMINEAKAIQNDPALGYATGAAAPLSAVPGTGAKRVAARLDTLKAKTLLNVLGSLKDLSKNGSSGFGQLSEIEGENIRNSISTLDRKQSTEDFKNSIDRFITEMEARKANLRDTFNSTYGQIPGGNVPTQTQPQTPALHSAALDWANSNPNDPRAAAVKKKALQDLGAAQ